MSTCGDRKLLGYNDRSMLAQIALLLGLATPAPTIIGTAPAQTIGAGDAAGAETERRFAEILELEDLRSAGDGALLSYLDRAQPLSVRVRAALAIGRIGSPVTTPFDLIGPL